MCANDMTVTAAIIAIVSLSPDSSSLRLAISGPATARSSSATTDYLDH